LVDDQLHLRHVLAKGRWMVRDAEPVQKDALEEPV
jgi:hypothetical protein